MSLPCCICLVVRWSCQALIKHGREADAGARENPLPVKGPGGDSRSSWQNLVNISTVKGAVRVGAESGRVTKGSSRAEARTAPRLARPGVEKGSVRKGLGVLFLLTSRRETAPAQLAGRQEIGQREGHDFLLAPGRKGREERKPPAPPAFCLWDFGCELSMMLIFLLIFLGPKFRKISDGSPMG